MKVYLDFHFIYFWILIVLILCCGSCAFVCLPIMIITTLLSPENDNIERESPFMKLGVGSAPPEPTNVEKVVKAVKGAANLSLDPLDHLPEDLCQICKCYIVGDQPHVTLPCSSKHKFHAACMQIFKEKKDTSQCPTCGKDYTHTEKSVYQSVPSEDIEE